VRVLFITPPFHAGVVEVGGYGMGYGMHPGMMGGCGGPEGQKFFDDTRDLRREMHGKMFDYMELMRDPEASREDVEKLREEMWELKKQIHERAEQAE
jgi:Spy/CpxP family protein refolding chaperone